MAFVLFPELEAHKTVLDQAQLVMNLMTQIQAVPRQHEAIAVSCDAHINILQESVSVISDSVREHLDAIQQLTKVRTSMTTMAMEFMVFRRTIAHEQAPLQAVATPSSRMTHHYLHCIHQVVRTRKMMTHHYLHYQHLQHGQGGSAQDPGNLEPGDLNTSRFLGIDGTSISALEK